jgi:hypothetical protein
VHLRPGAGQCARDENRKAARAGGPERRKMRSEGVSGLIWLISRRRSNLMRLPSAITIPCVELAVDLLERRL